MIEAYMQATLDVLRLAGQMFLARMDDQLRWFSDDLRTFIHGLERNPRRDWRERFDAMLAEQASRDCVLTPESREILIAYLEVWERNVFGGPPALEPPEDRLDAFDTDAAARLWDEIQKEQALLETEQRRREFIAILSKMEPRPTRPEPSTLDKAGEYLLDSGEQVLLGDYTDKVTGLGTSVQVAGGLTGLDLPADLRDLSANILYWETSWSYVGKTTLNAIALLPLVGVIKYLDEAAAVAKNADETVDITKARYAVGPYNEAKGLASGLDAHHVGQQAAMKRLVPGYNPATAPSVLVPEVGHTIRDSTKTLSRSHKGLETARDVIARDIHELRRVYPDIPNAQLQYLVNLNKLLYPAALRKPPR